MMRLFLISLLAAALQANAESPPRTADGFDLPQASRVFSFPADHGSHPGFRTEWWYVTGHLDGAGGKRFGFQVTFFRQASPAGQQIYLAHATLLDVPGKRFISEERLNREGWDAESSTSTLDVHNGNWSLKLNGDVLVLNSTVKSEVKLRLKMVPAKPLVIFGKDGVSRKGVSPEASSHYLTFPLLQCSGVIAQGAGDIAVTGQAWMDHEFSSSQLDRDQVGWDWASLQLNDGREIMAYRMRKSDGQSDSAGTTLAKIQSNGQTEQVGAAEFTWSPGRNWSSPATGAVYPIEATIGAQGEQFHLKPLFDAQELDGKISGLPYWEGACDVLNAKGETIGRAFLELAGYSGNLSQHLRAPVTR